MAVEVVIVGVAAPDAFVADVAQVPTRFTFPPLRGVANDVTYLDRFFRMVLSRRPERYSVKIVDQEPTVTRILSAVRDAASRLAEGAALRNKSGLPPGEHDTLIVALSGHGVSIPGDGSYQGDIQGLDPTTTEVFIAQNMFIPSAKLRAAWSAVDHDMTLVTIVDACSADGIAILEARESRPPIEIPDTRPGRAHFSVAAAKELEKAKSGRFETLTGRDDGGRVPGYFGLLTRALVDTWCLAEPATYGDWFRTAGGKVTLDSDQTPVIRYVGPRPDLLPGTRPFF